MGKNVKNLKLKRYAKMIQRKGRFGDTELAHINKDEEELLARYRGAPLSKNPETGVKEAFDPVTMALVSGGMQLLGAGFGARSAKKAAARKKAALEKQYKIASTRTGDEIGYEQRLRRQAQQGTMNVGQLTSEATRSGYARGRTAQAGVQGQLAMSGLENSIVAQELRRKTDVATLRSINNQARKIAMANEKTKLQAQGQLDKYNLQRSQYLRKLGVQRAQGMFQADESYQQAKSDATQKAWGAVGNMVMGGMKAHNAQMTVEQGGFQNITNPTGFVSQFNSPETLAGYMNDMSVTEKMQFYNWAAANAPEDWFNQNF
ncbi:MAG: hypothetical protein Unbinned5336contig1001_25 [Prokaryotic dsDNA virus sp.]|nr:MAG: hypothetical protein Unbinned5336contig1001_25 [Prokaryotic dsDNA virus sp.]|tara:strand:- start:33755 stop:34708 length:954 start_codon:yes stop_codon:yes gene_type:complete